MGFKSNYTMEIQIYSSYKGHFILISGDREN